MNQALPDFGSSLVELVCGVGRPAGAGWSWFVEQDVISDESTGSSQAKELPGLAGRARQEPVADRTVVDRWTRVGVILLSLV